MVSPRDFYNQFGFYPFENNEELVKYDLSEIDYTYCNLSNSDVRGCNLIGNNEYLNLKNTKYDEKEKIKRKV